MKEYKEIFKIAYAISNNKTMNEQQRKKVILFALVFGILALVNILTDFTWFFFQGRTMGNIVADVIYTLFAGFWVAFLFLWVSRRMRVKWTGVLTLLFLGFVLAANTLFVAYPYSRNVGIFFCLVQLGLIVIYWKPSLESQKTKTKAEEKTESKEEKIIKPKREVFSKLRQMVSNFFSALQSRFPYKIERKEKSKVQVEEPEIEVIVPEDREPEKL